MIERLAAGAALAAAVALAAFRTRALDRGGAIAAFAVGTAIWTACGWPAAVVLFGFFIPSSLLSRAGRERKRAIVDAGKHGPRDALQVLANGGIAATCAVLAALANAPLAAAAFAAAFAGSLAAASADTWGTEIGTLARKTPRSILTGAAIPAGLSGGVTFVGTAAECAGAALVASIAWLLHVAPFGAVAAGGIAGALLDSILGASLQELRWCPVCSRACETNPHVCGTPTVLQRGAGWIGNDAVNFAATFGGAIAAAAIVVATSR
ncbi:MAG: DUF92 domain-containing protein [Vulcanimicrobiaceae bacterium]